MQTLWRSLFGYWRSLFGYKSRLIVRFQCQLAAIDRSIAFDTRAADAAIDFLDNEACKGKQRFVAVSFFVIGA